MENKGDPLPVPPQTTSAGKTKTMKKDEQYRFMYSELEKFLACHERSDRHAKVLDCLLECRNKPIIDRISKDKADNDAGDKVELDVALREIERYSAMTEREKSDFNLSRDGVLRSTTQSPLSPPPSKRTKTTFPAVTTTTGGKGGGLSLLAMFCQRQEKENSKRHVQFAGLRNIGDKAKLYLNLERALKEKEMQAAAAAAAAAEKMDA
jgi:hypothetical protein